MGANFLVWRHLTRDGHRMHCHTHWEREALDIWQVSCSRESREKWSPSSSLTSPNSPITFNSKKNTLEACFADFYQNSAELPISWVWAQVGHHEKLVQWFLTAVLWFLLLLGFHWHETKHFFSSGESKGAEGTILNWINHGQKHLWHD